MAINYELINKGGISLGTNFELLSEKPLDSRLVVPTLEGLQNYIDNAAAYAGMIVYVTSEDKHYQVNADKTYRQFGTTQEELESIIANATTAAMEFKGVTASLPENPAKGDMYKVAGENISIKIDDVDAKVGDSIVYNGEQWFLIPSGDDIEDTWRPVTDVANDATLTFAAGDKLDVAVASNGTITYSHEAIDAPELLAENEQTRTYITEVETDGFGHITGYKTTTENVVDTNTTYEFEGQAEESSVYFNVTSSEENADSVTVYLDAYSKNETDAAIKVVADDLAAYDRAHENDYDNDTIDSAVSTAQANAEAKAAELDAALKSELQAEIDSDVKVVSDALAEYIEANDAAVADKVAQSAYDADKATFATKTEVSGVEAQLANYVTSANYTSDKEVIDAAIADRYTKAQADAAFVKVEDAYNDSEVRGLISDNAEAIEDLEKYVGAIPTTEEAYKDITNVIAYVNKKAEETLAAASGNSSETAASVKQQLDNYKSENNTRVAGIEGDIAEIQADYLKAEDIAEFETKANVQKVADDLADEIEARTQADAGFETRVAKLEANFGTGEGTVDSKIAAAVKAEEDARKAAIEGVQGEVAAVDAKFADYTKTADVNAELAKKADKTQVATDIASAIAPLATTEALNGVKATAEAAAVKTEVEAALALKADKSVVEAMYTNDQIDGFVAGAKSYADGLITEANLDQYTTEQEVKDIVDGVIKTATSKETLDSLVELVEYIDTHSGDAINMATAIGVLEGKVDVIEKKPAYGISSGDISNWNTVKETVDTNKATWDLAGTALQAADLNGYALETYVDKAEADAVAEAARDAAAKYETIGTAQGIVDALKLGETYEPIGAETRAKSYTDTEISDFNTETVAPIAARVKAIEDAPYATAATVATAKQEAIDTAKEYADSLEHANTTYTVAATENALEFTVTPSEGVAQTVKLVAPEVDTGVMEVTAGTDMVVTPGEDGTVEVAHKAYSTGTVKDAAHDSATDPSFITGIEIENGHVTGATVRNLAEVLEAMEFIFDGGSAN